jgi:hypothetical protein
MNNIHIIYCLILNSVYICDIGGSLSGIGPVDYTTCDSTMDYRSQQVNLLQRSRQVSLFTSINQVSPIGKPLSWGMNGNH